VLSEIACDYEKPLKNIYEKQEQRQLKKLDFEKETKLQMGEIRKRISEAGRTGSQLSRN
jgi:hypothetical protein